jgi:hypothetical protein
MSVANQVLFAVYPGRLGVLVPNVCVRSMAILSEKEGWWAERQDGGVTNGAGQSGKLAKPSGGPALGGGVVHQHRRRPTAAATQRAVHAAEESFTCKRA